MALFELIILRVIGYTLLQVMAGVSLFRAHTARER